ncbi:hypothetical protein DCAR_0934461 [Daucus carota subsp. sativus]|uniref:Uncharacterized protein n=1 Tax=Daucus carota subsp. sativus TaxID=79200 RepID=A0AAF1BI44_DAUCS|nr:hypothetical protein DCAR_0934461 [Daucus carota subsp. sativus]
MMGKIQAKLRRTAKGTYKTEFKLKATGYKHEFSDSSEVAVQVLDSGLLKELSSLFEAEVIDLEAVVWEGICAKNILEQAVHSWSENLAKEQDADANPPLEDSLAFTREREHDLDMIWRKFWRSGINAFRRVFELLGPLSSLVI